MNKGRVNLAGEVLFGTPDQAGIGAALREAHRIDDEGDAQMRRLIEQLNKIESRGSGGNESPAG